MRVSVTDGRGRPVRAGGLGRWLAAVAPPRARGEVAIAIVSDARMRALNRQYRRTDRATDVLSFPAGGTRAGGTRGFRLQAEDPLLGDIVIASGVARRQARDAAHAYDTELRVLALHGLLHLLGYDHDGDDDAGRMARVESRLRRRAGLAAGLIERGVEPARAARGRVARPRTGRGIRA